jgi:D-glycero-D-manno-heptose 1,7-bisphosphate phosphatase
VNKVVLIDRDGVLNVDRVHSVRSMAELEVIPGADQGVAALCAAGYRVLVVTNQAVVGRGELAYDALQLIHAHLQAWVGAAGGHLSGFYVCTHTPVMNCNCRKPRPGLIEQAWTDWNFDRQDTWFVGDSSTDVTAALAGHCRPALVRTGKGGLSAGLHPQVPIWPDLLAFASALTQGRIPMRSTS